MSELAISAYAAESGRHVLERPRTFEFRSFLRSFDEQAERLRLEQANLRYVGRSEPGFPAALRAIHDPPVGLYVRGPGALDLLTGPAVAIVGARGCSSYGRGVARSLGREAASAGLAVVSGLARGVDAEAHRGVLDADGTTIAVLGCGIDRDYPAAHGELAERICGRGLIVSEYAPGVEPAPWRFPARNRIIAGLCAATVVVEARERSGALITADFALEEGREVLAVPGEITSMLSVGTNALLPLGATPLLSPDDVLRACGLEPGDAVPRTIDESQRAVLESLGAGSAGVDELSRRTGLPPGELAALLAQMELSGVVVSDAGVYRPSVV